MASAAAGLLSACQTAPQQPSSQLMQLRGASEAVPVGVLGSACIYRVELGRDEILEERSREAATTLVTALTQQLSTANMRAVSASAPYLCPQVTAETMKNYDLLVSGTEKAQKVTQVPVINPDYEQKLPIELLGKLRVPTKFDRKTKIHIAQPVDLSDAEVAQIKAAVGADFVMIGDVGANKLSFGALAAYSSLTAVTTVAMVNAGASTIFYQQLPPKQVSVGVYLVDLNEKVAIWSSSAVVMGKVFDSYYGDKSLPDPLAINAAVASLKP